MLNKLPSELIDKIFEYYNPAQEYFKKYVKTEMDIIEIQKILNTYRSSFINCFGYNSIDKTPLFSAKAVHQEITGCLTNIIRCKDEVKMLFQKTREKRKLVSYKGCAIVESFRKDNSAVTNGEFIIAMVLAGFKPDFVYYYDRCHHNVYFGVIPK